MVNNIRNEKKFRFTRSTRTVLIQIIPFLKKTTYHDHLWNDRVRLGSKLYNVTYKGKHTSHVQLGSNVKFISTIPNIEENESAYIDAVARANAPAWYCLT